MPSTSRPTCAEPQSNPFGVFACAVLMTVFAVIGVWRAVAAEAPQARTVVMQGMKFSPAVLHIRAGETVVFKNDDFLPHTATASAPGRFDSGMINPGASWSVTPAAPGVVPYHCTFHPTMEGRLIVDGK